MMGFGKCVHINSINTSHPALKLPVYVQGLILCKQHTTRDLKKLFNHLCYNKTKNSFNNVYGSSFAEEKMLFSKDN